MKLQKFILNNPDWEEKLSDYPYYLTIKRKDGYVLFKYNQQLSDFNNEIVREARGIIFREKDWKCVCHGFDKFGNYGESYCPDIKWEGVSVQEKIDGSLIKIWYCEDDGWHISTNGCIDALDASYGVGKDKNYRCLFEKAILNSNLQDWGEFKKLMYQAGRYNTYMFELVSPLDKHVILYPETKLYFLGFRNNKNNKEYLPEDSIVSCYFSFPKRYKFRSLEDVVEISKLLPYDEEGYVVCEKYFNRIKIKSPKYIKAHYLRNNGHVTDERLIDIILKGEQEEFQTYLNEYSDRIELLKTEMIFFENACNQTLFEIRQKHFSNRKEYADIVNLEPKRIRAFLFKAFDKGKDYRFADFSCDWNANDWVRVLFIKE